MMKSNLLFFIFSIFLLASCSTTNKVTNQKQESAMSPIGTWQLNQLENTDVSAVKSREPIQLNLSDEDKVNGFSGCNRFFGSYKLGAKNEISFEPLASTKMACPNSEFDEHAFLKIFSDVAQYEVEEDQLILKDKDGNSLARFVRAPEKHSAEILDKYWKLMTLGGKEVKMSENQKRERFFTLHTEDKRVNGFAGCNTFMGSYTLKKDQEIEFSQMASTLMACLDTDVKDSDFLQVFEKVKTYKMEGDALTFKDKDGKELATFNAVYMD